MDMYEIIRVPSPILKTQSQAVEEVNDAIAKQMARMLATMYGAPGIGLAANQIGLLNRVLVMDLSSKKDGEEPNPICMANPEIIWSSDDISLMEEGCLSLPGQYAEVERPAEVRVKYLDQDGKLAELKADGLLAHCVQHEIDHLDGLVFVDHISSLKRKMILKKLAKADKLNKNQEIL